MSYQDTALLIDGSWGPSAAGRFLTVLNPATGEPAGKVAHAERADLDRALEAAARGFEVWRRVSAFDRSKVMRKAANLLRERADMIAALMTTEQGKPLVEAKGETMAGADVIDWFAEEARRSYGRVIPARAEGVYGRLRNGVLGASFDHNGNLLTAGRDQVVRFWTTDGQTKQAFDISRAIPVSTCISHDGKTLICGDSAGELHFWNAP